MRLECSPERQRQHNGHIQRQLRLVAILSVSLVVLAVGLEAGLYFGLRPQAAVPTIVGPDGNTILGFAVPLTPELVVAAINPPSGSHLLVAGAGQVRLDLVRTQTVEGVNISLLRLQQPYPKEIPQARAVQNGEEAFAATLTGRWEGTLSQRSQNGDLEAEPAVAVGSVAAVTAKSDQGLLAVIAPGQKGDTLIPIRQLLMAFPELKK